jgi:hypothetical protein
MRLLAAVAMLITVTASPAFAQREPEIVIPGHPGVPVMINGIDASWGVVEGEFGLDRPGLVAPTVIYRPRMVSVPESPGPGYFPRDNRKPGYGRLEIVPPPGAPKPRPAPSYYRSWSSQSAPGPVTDYPPYPAPPIVYSPNIELNQQGQHHHHHP